MKFIITLSALAVLFLFTTTVLAVPCVPGSTSTQLCNPAERPGYTGGDPLSPGQPPPATNLISLLTKFIFIIAGFATTMPVVAVAYSGFSMVISQGNEEGITRAKTGLTWAVVGFVVAILSFVSINAMIGLLEAGRIPDPAAPPSVITNPLDRDIFGLFVLDLVGNLLEIVGVVAVLMLIIAGIRYVTSAGNEEQARQGKRAVQWAVAGILVILLSYVIIKAAAGVFGIS